MHTARQVLNSLKKHSNKEYAAHHAKFFQTHKGGYGEGDLFLGLMVPQTRLVAKEFYKTLPLSQAEILLSSPYHEARLCALVILTLKFAKAAPEEKTAIAKLYLNNAKYINNWDLVDVSCYKILGPLWFNEGKTGINKLRKLARSKNLWLQRIAVITTMHFTKNNNCAPAFEMAKFFIGHKHDLMHKATGWMLREAGKIEPQTLLEFLNINHKTMPRTMLRYSIEKLSPAQKRRYMQK